METVCSPIPLLTSDDANHEQALPPGFRFHPTDEELVTFYLVSKVFNARFSFLAISEIDLNKCEPWDLPETAKLGEKEWYFYSVRDRKYPMGLRTNRATDAGYWKATGKDREICISSTKSLVGMKKTLVFYRGRAPRGVKTNWLMHEYRLEGDLSCRINCKEERVICRIFLKVSTEKNAPHIQPKKNSFSQEKDFSHLSLPALVESPANKSNACPIHIGGELQERCAVYDLTPRNHPTATTIPETLIPLTPLHWQNTPTLSYEPTLKTLKEKLAFVCKLERENPMIFPSSPTNDQFERERGDLNFSWMNRSQLGTNACIDMASLDGLSQLSASLCYNGAFDADDGHNQGNFAQEGALIGDSLWFLPKHTWSVISYCIRLVRCAQQQVVVEINVGVVWGEI